MALAHRRSGHTSRAPHLFDSFQGLPEPDQASDGEMAASYVPAKERRGCYGASVSASTPSKKINMY